MPRRPKKSTGPKRRASAVHEKSPKTYRLAESTIRAAQEILGAPTATATIETALDMVVFRKELVAGTAAMLGVEITPAFDRDG